MDKNENQNDNLSFEKLSEKRNKFVSSLNENNFYDGFKNLLTLLYPDNAHYIYELLQNAQDANKDNDKPATVKFTLTKSRLEFEHNCKKLFDIKDIESITGIANTTKMDDKTNIGKFGVGFKSVFTITNTPEIKSGKYHFIIEKLFIPKLVEYLSGNEPKSFFIFPFDNPNKPPEQAFKEIKNELYNLSNETLLFLKNINRLEYKLPYNDQVNYLERNDIGNNIIVIKLKKQNEEEKEYYWLRYDKNVSIIDEKGELVNCSISIAFKLQNEEQKDIKNKWKINIAEQKDTKNKWKVIKAEQKDTKNKWKIIKAEQGKTYIFFLTEKEDSKLFFYIHAPFASTVARDSIRECEDNIKLRDAIAELISSSMTDIKERNLLSIDFLGILPNSQDNLSDFYKPILNKIIDIFQNKPILPTKNGNFAPSSTLFRGPVSISDIITDDDLSFLTAQKVPLWVKNAPQQNQREDHFLDDLNIKIWGDNELNKCFNPKKHHDIDKIQNWIAIKPDNWLLKLYSLLEEREISIGDELRNLRIVRTTTNKHTIASETYFPPNDEDLPASINFVKLEVFNKDDTERRMEKAKIFLSKLGVKTYNDKEKIKIHIKSLVQKYDTETPNVSEDQHLEDIEYLIKNIDESKELLKWKHFVLDIKTVYRTADAVCSSEIAELIEYSDLALKYKKYTINNIYDKLKEDIRGQFYSLLENLGFMNKLKVVYIVDENKIFKSTLYQRITNYTIIGIDNILPLINEEKCKFCFSLLIWNAICECDFNGEEIYKKGLPNDGRYKYYNVLDASEIVKKLSSNTWLPDKDRNLYKPQDISLDMLPNEFRTNYNQKSHILIALKFGENVLRKREIEKQKKQKEDEAASILGLSPQLISIIKEAKNAGINIENYLNEQINKKNFSTETEDFCPQEVEDKFPTGKIKNLLSLQERIREDASKAEYIRYQKKLRHIRISRERDIERNNIGGYYNRFCQLCGEKKNYWDIAQIFNIEKKEIGNKKEFWYMNLSLCPICAHKYRKLRKNSELMRSFRKNIIDANITDANQEKEIEIPLGEEKVKFRHDHLAEIQEILKLESENNNP